MAKKKPPVPTARVSVIHLIGHVDERDYLTSLSKLTHFSKATIIRLALADWAKARKLPAPPTKE